jgi:hypothetical protein
MMQRSRRSTAFGEPDDTVMLWGYPAATMIDAGVQRLITRLDTAWYRYPTVAKIDDHIYGGTATPEITEGIIYAAQVSVRMSGVTPHPPRCWPDCSSSTLRLRC